MKLKIRMNDMYYEERTRFGKIYYRTTPKGKWCLKKVQVVGDLTDYSSNNTGKEEK